MARYQLILAYDGTDFQGFQRQGKKRTVQAEVEAALRRLNWQGRTILAAGRTDSGVHASGQVIAFDLDWAHPPDVLARALNAYLPKDVAVQSACLAADDFHPRYQARYRLYRYRLFCKAERNPLLERFAWRVWPPVEPDRLQAAAQLFIGTHDFAAFGSPPRPGGSTIRTVFHAFWEAQANGWQFEVAANAFLYRMVRRLVFLQVLAGQGRLSLLDLAQGVTQAQVQTPGLAPPQGLTLAEVGYDLQKQES